MIKKLKGEMGQILARESCWLQAVASGCEKKEVLSLHKPALCNTSAQSKVLRAFTTKKNKTKLRFYLQYLTLCLVLFVMYFAVSLRV